MEDKGQWMCDSGEVHVERMMGSGREERREKRAGMKSDKETSTVYIVTMVAKPYCCLN